MMHVISNNAPKNTSAHPDVAQAPQSSAWLEAADQVHPSLSPPREALQISPGVPRPLAAAAWAGAPVRPIVRVPKPVNELTAKWVGAGAGFVTLGVVIGVCIYLSVRGFREKDKSWDTFLDNFCTANPFAYIGSKADCINYWGQQQSPQQVCDRTEPAHCVTFDTSPVNLHLGMSVGGEVTGILSALAWPFAVALGWAVGRSWAARHNRQINRGAGQQV